MTKITKDQLKVLQANAPAGTSFEDLQSTLIDKGYEIEGVDTAAAKAYNVKKSLGFPSPAEVQNNMQTNLDAMPQTPEKQGLLKTIGKDVLNTLLVKPAARATEAITRLMAPNSMAAKGYEMMADEGESQNIMGMEVNPVKAFGQGGGRQIAGETLKVGSYLFPYGKVAGLAGKAALGASKLTPTALRASKIAGNVASGATGGYMADVGFKLEDESKTLGEAFTPGLGTALGAAIPLAGPLAKVGKAAIVGNRTVSDATRRVIQGSTKDIPLAEQAFKSIDTKGVTTRQELSDRLKTAMESQMDVVDAELGKNTKAIPMKDLVTVGKNNAGQEVKTNVVKNALDHLKQFYADAGDNVSASNVQLIKQKAMTEGLTHQEVNNIARMYSEEFGSKAFNKMGDPLTSVNAQMFENTRTGLKQIARSGISGKEAAQADRLYSAMSNTKRLVDKGAEAVSKLEGRIQNRNILQKLSYAGAKLVNTLTGGALKAGVEALGVSNIGNKIDNWMGLEKSLKNDLEFIRKANMIKDDNALIKFINETAKKVKFPGDAAVDDISKRVEQVKATPNKQGGFVSLKGKGTIPENSLISEARKYKSAEEFVKAQGTPVYHGTNAEFDNFDVKKIGTQTDDGMFGKGFYFAPNKKMAQQAPSGATAKFVKEANLDMKNPLEIQNYKSVKELADHLEMSESAFIKDSNGIIRPVNSQISQFTSHVKDAGYDGVYVRRNGVGDEIVVFNPEQIKTKSQLTDIWKKANNK